MDGGRRVQRRKKSKRSQSPRTHLRSKGHGQWCHTCQEVKQKRIEESYLDLSTRRCWELSLARPVLDSVNFHSFLSPRSPPRRAGRGCGVKDANRRRRPPWREGTQGSWMEPHVGNTILVKLHAHTSTPPPKSRIVANGKIIPYVQISSNLMITLRLAMQPFS